MHTTFMKLRLAALVLCAVSSVGSFAATSEEKSAMAFTQAICDAFKDGDLAMLESALAPEFTLVGGDSSVQDRRQTLAEVRAHEPRYEIFRNHGMSAHVYRDAAVVQGITSLKGTFHGKPFAADVRFTDTLIRAQGRWRIVVSHVTRIPQK
jgi:ketosteroid isomerase-like protein